MKKFPIPYHVPTEVEVTQDDVLTAIKTLRVPWKRAAAKYYFGVGKKIRSHGMKDAAKRFHAGIETIRQVVGHVNTEARKIALARIEKVPEH